MINKMALVQKLGLMVQNMKVNLLKGKNKAKGNLIIQMGVFIKENSLIINFMEKEFMNGKMEENLKEIGLIIK